MGKMEVAPLSRPPRERKPFPTTKVLLAVAIAVLVWIGYQQATKPREKEPEKGWILDELKRRSEPKVIYVVQKEKTTPAPDPVKEPDPFPDPPPPVIHEATQEIPVKPPPPNAAAVLAPPRKPVEAKRETTDEIIARCLQFTVERENTPLLTIPPSLVAVIHARNNCSFDLPGDNIWVTVAARGDNGGVEGTDFGHFQGTIETGALTETRLAISCNPDRVRDLTVQFRYSTILTHLVDGDRH